MNNYEFCAQWILDQKPTEDVRILDYGCGAGAIIQELRKRGVNAVGCDVFYEGGDYSKLMDNELFADGTIKKMEGDAAPFEDNTFDYVINNQVMEHVEDLDAVLAEIARVLKPGGVVLSLFPNKGVWREGHCGIPFLHWFPKGSGLRVYYAAALRAIGLGHNKEDKGIFDWSRNFCEWLDNWTYYRPYKVVRATYGKHFEKLDHIEDDWFHRRLEGKSYLIAWQPAPLKKWIVNKMGGMVFTARKPTSE